MTSLIAVLHDRVFARRVRVLSEVIASVLPRNASVLDVGCGDGLIASRVMAARPDVTISGVDVLVRTDTRISVVEFDGSTVPAADGSYDAAMLIDVVHHAEDPKRLLAEVARVTRGIVVIKDHLADRFAARPVLRAMDWVGNARHGVRLPYNYWTRAQWDDAWRAHEMTVESWSDVSNLYPLPLSLIFGWRLHFLAALRRVPSEIVRSSSRSKVRVVVPS